MSDGGNGSYLEARVAALESKQEIDERRWLILLDGITQLQASLREGNERAGERIRAMADQVAAIYRRLSDLAVAVDSVRDAVRLLKETVLYRNDDGGVVE